MYHVGLISHLDHTLRSLSSVLTSFSLLSTQQPEEAFTRTPLWEILQQIALSCDL